MTTVAVADRGYLGLAGKGRGGDPSKRTGEMTLAKYSKDCARMQNLLYCLHAGAATTLEGRACTD